MQKLTTALPYEDNGTISCKYCDVHYHRLVPYEGNFPDKQPESKRQCALNPYLIAYLQLFGQFYPNIVLEFLFLVVA